MYKTRKRLKAEIARLQKEVAHHRLRSALVDKADLPKCKSVACYNCKYCTFLYNPSTSALYLLGCGKDLTCKDFIFTDKNKPPLWEREEALIRMEGKRESFESNPSSNQAQNLNGAMLVVPRPPCHSA